MLKRMRWVILGYALGLSTSYFVMTRLRRVVDRYSPPEIRHRIESQVASLRGDVRAALVEGREAMSQREEQLRAEWSPARAAEAG